MTTLRWPMLLVRFRRGPIELYRLLSAPASPLWRPRLRRPRLPLASPLAVLIMLSLSIPAPGRAVSMGGRDTILVPGVRKLGPRAFHVGSLALPVGAQGDQPLQKMNPLGKSSGPCCSVRVSAPSLQARGHFTAVSLSAISRTL